jgi:hypothetical protein
VLHTILHALKFCAIYLRNVLHFSLVLGILKHHLMGSEQWLCMAKSFKVSALEAIWFDGLWKMVNSFLFQTRISFFSRFCSDQVQIRDWNLVYIYTILNLILKIFKLFCKPYYTAALFYLALFKVRDPTGSGAVRTWMGGSRAGISNFGLTTPSKTRVATVSFSS